MSELRSRPAWRALETHYEGLRGPHLRVPFHRYAGQRFGITPEEVVRAALESLERSRERIVATPA
jgi:hypothetical protein